MKKMLCLLLAVLLCQIAALAEESADAPATLQELNIWAADYHARALAATPLNTPADSRTPDGYEFIYEFATLYANTPEMTADTILNAVVLTNEEETGPRGVCVGDALSEVLSAYYTENEHLLGTKESALLYAVDALPDSAAWGQVLRDGQRVSTVHYGVHELLPEIDAYCDAGVIHTMTDNRVHAIRVYGLSSLATRQQVDEVLYNLHTSAQEQTYAQVPFSYDGLTLTDFALEDLAFSGLDFLSLTPEAAQSVLGAPASDEWMADGEDAYIRLQRYDGFELTYTYDKNKENCRIYMLLITEDGLEGPRAVRCGDAFTSVFNRFRNGMGEMDENGVEMLYGENGVGSYGKATYGGDASARLRYGFEISDGRKVVLQLNFSMMSLDEIMLFVD